MQASEVYARLEKDFIKHGLSDDWAQHMASIQGFLAENFKERSMGLVCDNTPEIAKVFTAVFPSEKVMKEILGKGVSEAMLFVHHPRVWDICKAPEVFQDMRKELLEEFRENKISIYNLHVLLDNFGEYSTSGTLAKALGLEIEKPFAPYFGSLAGVFCKTSIKTVQELHSVFEKAISHKASLYNYGDSEIKDGLVAVAAGGGNDVEVCLKEIAKEGINTFVTGITALNSHSQKAHDFDKENKINVLGGTHYSTEKFACIKMCDYFRKQGLPSEFIPDSPVMEDL